MTTARFVALLVSFFTLPLFAQQHPSLGFDQSRNNNVLQMPEQLHRVPPPSRTASKNELEEQGDILRAEKSFSDAIDYYRAAIKLGDTPALENKTGIAELQLLHISEARQRFLKATKLDKRYADAYNNLGVVYYIQRNYGKAVKTYDRAIAERPDFASYHSNLGSAYFARKDFDKASAEYIRAMQIDPDVFNRQSLSAVSIATGSPADRARFNFTIAKVFAKQGDTERCLLYLTKAIEDGFPAISDVYKEADFAGIIKDARFVSLMASKPEAVK